MRTLEHAFFAVPDFLSALPHACEGVSKDRLCTARIFRVFQFFRLEKQQTLDTTSLFPGNIIYIVWIMWNQQGNSEGWQPDSVQILKCIIEPLLVPGGDWAQLGQNKKSWGGNSGGQEHLVAVHQGRCISKCKSRQMEVEHMNQKGDNLGPHGHPGDGKNHSCYFITEVGSLRFLIVWGYCRKTASATAAEEDRMDLLWRIQCDFIASLAQGCSPVATMFGNTCRDFLIGVVVVLDLGALTLPRWCGVGWWCPARAWRQGVDLQVLVSNRCHTWQH